MMLVGDSFIAGTSADETRIAALLQASLTARNHPVRIEDHSAGGYGLVRGQTKHNRRHS